MTENVPLRCTCGRVSGRVLELAPGNVSRCVCYCDDCQAYLHHLGRAELLDANGGSEILQMAPARVRIERGEEELRCMRLSARAMYRFYTGCCRTPMGNTISPRLAFVGLLRHAVDLGGGLEGRADALLGTTYRVNAAFAIGTPPSDAHPKAPVAFVARIAPLLLRWTLRGRAQPSPYFDGETGAPRVTLEVLSAAERAALADRVRAASSA